MALAIDALVRNHAGVAALYRSGNALEAAVTAVKDALQPEGAAAQPFSDVSGDGGRIGVVVTIGVDSESAVETCRAVHDDIAGWLRERVHDDHAITVTVAHAVQRAAG